jgi:molecular chaperone DnaK
MQRSRRNRADQAVYAANVAGESGDSPRRQERAVEGAAESLRKAIDANDAAGINPAMEEHNQAQPKAAPSLYQQASTAGSGAGPTPGAGGGGAAGSSGGSSGDAGRAADGDVIDAEVVDEGKP